MTITFEQLLLYFGALIILFLTPGPVWVAIIARTLAGGVKSALSITLGVSLGDMLWPIVVFFGLGFLITIYSDILILIRYLASLILGIMGIQIILASKKEIFTNSSLTRSGFFSGLYAGFIAVTANPKASLFYLTLLPSFFEFNEIGFVDILVISTVSFLVPLLGHFLMILFVSRVSSFLTSPKSIQITNIISGILLIGVGITIGLT